MSWLTFGCVVIHQGGRCCHRQNSYSLASVDVVEPRLAVDGKVRADGNACECADVAGLVLDKHWEQQVGDQSEQIKIPVPDTR